VIRVSAVSGVPARLRRKHARTVAAAARIDPLSLKRIVRRSETDLDQVDANRISGTYRPQIELVQVTRARHARFFPGFISPLGSKARLTSSWSRTAPGGPLSTQVTVFDDAYSVFAGDRAVELDR
jgi:hypothetical protein